MYKKIIKRMVDIVLSFIGIVVLAIPMLFISIMIKIDSPGPVLFKQKRVGINKSHFMIYVSLRIFHLSQVTQMLIRSILT